MALLLQCYAAEGPRVVRHIQGRHLLRPALAADLLLELRRVDWASTLKERPTVQADGYVTLQHPRCMRGLTKTARANMAKLQQLAALWALIVQVSQYQLKMINRCFLILMFAVFEFAFRVK